jgi:hypothetical protein
MSKVFFQCQPRPRQPGAAEGPAQSVGHFSVEEKRTNDSRQNDRTPHQAKGFQASM